MFPSTIGIFTGKNISAFLKEFYLHFYFRTMGRYQKKKKKQREGIVQLRPRNVNRPPKRMQWTDCQMVAAMNAVQSGSSVSMNSAAKDHGVPATTLKDRLSGRVIHGT